MRALVYEGPRDMRMREIDVPASGPDDVLVQVAYSGICGSELSGFLGQNSLRKAPVIFGHEFSGTITQVGERVADMAQLHERQRVTVNPLVSCMHCRYCLRGQQQLCAERKLLSATLPGSNAEYIKVPAQSVLPIPDGMSLEQAALVEPTACAARAVELASPHPSDTALVIGMGPIGLLVLEVLKVHGVSDIIAVDLNEERLEIARRAGAVTLSPGETDVVEEIRRITDGVGVELAIEAVGTDTTRQQCIHSVASGGRVIFIGLHASDSTLPVNTIIRSEIRCIGSFAYSALNFRTALQWLEQGRVRLDGKVVKSPLEEGPQWFERLLTSPGDVTKVLLCPGDGAGMA